MAPDLEIPFYFPHFLWKFWLSPEFGTANPRVHVYDVYDNDLSETRQPPYQTSVIFHNLNAGSLDCETQDVLHAVERAFISLESEVQNTLDDLLHQIDGSPKLVPLPLKSIENLRKYFVFLRFRNSAKYRDIVLSFDSLIGSQRRRISPAFHHLFAGVRRRLILDAFLGFLQFSSDDDTRLRRRSPTSDKPTDVLIHNITNAMETYCWRFVEADVSVGFSAEDQEYMLPECCFGTLDEGFDEDPACCDLFFPILPTVALYILSNSSSKPILPPAPNDLQIDDTSSGIIQASLELSIDIHLRNTMILQTYPRMLFFSSLRSAALSIASYDEFRWTKEHQDYSRMKQRCRQKFLQETVTKTLVVKGCIIVTDLTDEVVKVGEEPIAFGSFADVWKGVWADPVERRPKVVALKYLRQVMFQNVREKLLKRLQAEVVAWHRLCHRNISQLFGIVQSANSIAMVSQWCENGTICHYLKQNPSANRLNLLIQIASGIAYLHSVQPIVIHGDLKGNNILIDKQCQAIITDFGLSRVIEDVSPTPTNLGGTSFFAGSTRWMAPELIQALVEDDGRIPPVTRGSDVYAFASVCLEIATDELPYPNRTNDHAVIIDIIRGIKPSSSSVIARTAGCSLVKVNNEKIFWEMLERCWDAAKEMRPGMGELLMILEGLVFGSGGG